MPAPALFTDLPDSIKNASLREFILETVPKVDASEPLQTALSKYELSSFPVIFVVDHQGGLVGMITDNDLTKITDADRQGTVGEFISKTPTPIVAINASAKLTELLGIMNGDNSQKRIIDKLPVVDDVRRPVGIIDRDKLTIQISAMLAQALARAL
jgi:CBS domain-containing protein